MPTSHLWTSRKAISLVCCSRRELLSQPQKCVNVGMSGDEQSVCRTTSAVSQLHSMSSIGSKSTSDSISFEGSSEAVTPASQQIARLSLDPIRLTSTGSAGSKSFEEALAGAAMGYQEATTPHSGDSQKSTQGHAEVRSVTLHGAITSGVRNSVSCTHSL